MEQAGIILGILPLVKELDLEHCKACIKQMYKDANLMDATAALNVKYNPTKAQLIRVQAMALESLVNYKEQLILVEELKEKIKAVDEQTEAINEMFGG